MSPSFLEPVELRARKDGSSIGHRLTRDSADVERDELVRLGWSVEIVPVGSAAGIAHPAEQDMRSARRSARRRRLRALERSAVHARAVRDHLQAVWERTESNRRALDRLRRTARVA